MDVTALAGLAVAAGVLLAATVFGLWWRGRPAGTRAVSAVQPGADLAALGVTAGVPATLLQFSSAFCAPCRATRVVCRHVADQVAGVRHVEVDAESQLEQVRALGVWRTPTVFVIDAQGRVVSRISGQPTRAQVMEAVAPLLPCEVGS